MPRGRPPGSKNKIHLEEPRGKQTSYAWFVQICREEHRKKFPHDHVEFVEFSKKCADRWKIMSEREKRRFYQLAEDDAKRYEMEKHFINQRKDKLIAVEEEEAKKRAKLHKRKMKKMKDPNAPKRCMSAFFWFSQEERPKVKAANPDFGIGDVAKELGRRWSEAEKDVRDKFEDLAEKDRERYDQEKRTYQKRQVEESCGKISSSSSQPNNHLHASHQQLSYDNEEEEDDEDDDETVREDEIEEESEDDD